MDIVVKKDFSVSDIKAARVKAAAFRRSQATSGASNVLDMADLGKSVVLCDAHTKQFATPKVLSKYGYRKMTDYPYVIGDCDYCKVRAQCQFFMREDIFNEVWRTKEQQRRDMEYSAICRG